MQEEAEAQNQPRPQLSELVAVLLRRRWWILGPLFLCVLAGCVICRLWPFLYTSEALILVEQQRVPEQYVMANVVSNIQNRLDSMTQRILSRSRLRVLIERLDLYARERARMTMDEVIDLMREHIRVEIVQTTGRPGELTGFRIYYSATNAQSAQRVTNELASLFIEENLRGRTEQSVNTTTFFENQLEEARKELARQEGRLREYKLRHLGQLPEQQQANLQILSSLEAQLYGAIAALDRAEQQMVYLDSLEAQYRTMREEWAPPTSSSVVAGTNSTAAEGSLYELRKKLSELRTKYTPRHPEIRKLEMQIAEWESRASARIKAAEGPPREPRSIPGSALAEVESKRKAIVVEVARHKKTIEDLRERIREIQGRLDITPVREQELAEVTRMYENSRGHYQSLLQKKLQSELATNLEKRQQGEQFRVLDPASLPAKPRGRLQVLLSGWVLGVAAGLVLALFFEVLYPAVHSERDVAQFTAVPVLASIPVVRTSREESRWKHMRVLEAVFLALLFIVSGGLSAETYLMG